MRAYPDRFEPPHGALRHVVRGVVEGFLKCGRHRNGFARVRCPSCRGEILVAFSCQTRNFCPSCQAKRGALLGERLLEEVLLPVPNLHMVFTIPKVLRGLFEPARRLLGLLARCAYRAVRSCFQAVLQRRDALPGMVASIQTSGSALNWHPDLWHAARYRMSVTRTTAAFGVTRQTILNWRRLSPRKDPRLLPRIGTLSDLAREFLHRLRAEWPRWGTRRIAGQLARLGLRASRSTVQRILRRPRTPKPDERLLPETAAGLIARRPNHLWMIDFTRLKSVVRPVFVGAVIDTFSRKVLAIGLIRGEVPGHRTAEPEFCGLGVFPALRPMTPRQSPAKRPAKTAGPLQQIHDGMESTPTQHAGT